MNRNDAMWRPARRTALPEVRGAIEDRCSGRHSCCRRRVRGRVRQPGVLPAERIAGDVDAGRMARITADGFVADRFAGSTALWRRAMPSG